MRSWKQGPTLQHNRLKSDPRAFTFTVNATRNDGVRCFVQETHRFHFDICSNEEIVQAAKKIATELRARIDTYLHENCTCEPRQTLPCPIDHSREREQEDEG